MGRNRYDPQRRWANEQKDRCKLARRKVGSEFTQALQREKQEKRLELNHEKICAARAKEEASRTKDRPTRFVARQMASDRNKYAPNAEAFEPLGILSAAKECRTMVNEEDSFAAQNRFRYIRVQCVVVYENCLESCFKKYVIGRAALRGQTALLDLAWAIDRACFWGKPPCKFSTLRTQVEASIQFPLLRRIVEAGLETVLFRQSNLYSDLMESVASRIDAFIPGPHLRSNGKFVPPTVGYQHPKPSETSLDATKTHGQEHLPLVIQDVVHDEIAAEIPAREAAVLAEVHLASWIQFNAGAAADVGHSNLVDAPAFDHVLLLRLTRNPTELRERLHAGEELETLRAALNSDGYDTRLPSGAAIFVEPSHYSTVRHATSRVELLPHHIVVSQTFFPLVLEVLESMPSRRDVRLRSAQTLALLGNEATGFGDTFVVERTFLDILRPIHEPQSVTQSTSEAHGAPNPRRHIV